MKTTLDLPEPLVLEAKARAAEQGSELTELVAALLAQWLERRAGSGRPVRIVTDPELGISMIVCRPEASVSGMILEDWLELERKVLGQDDSARAGRSMLKVGRWALDVRA